jgi:hypothetical protein
MKRDRDRMFRLALKRAYWAAWKYADENLTIDCGEAAVRVSPEWWPIPNYNFPDLQGFLAEETKRLFRGRASLAGIQPAEATWWFYNHYKK